MEAMLQSPLGQTILEPGVVTIGSTSDSKVILHDAKVSQHHAVLRPTEQGYTITDWSSTEGTFVNNQRLEPFVPHLLTVGDRIRIGETVFTYEVHEGAALVAGQGSSPADEPTVLAAPAKHTAYGAGIQPSSAFPAQTQYGSGPQQGNGPAPPQLTDASPAASSAIPEYAYSVALPPQLYPPTTRPLPVTPVPPPPPIPPRKKLVWWHFVLIGAAILVLAGTGIWGYSYMTRPQPVISVTSDYHAGSIPAGSTDTVFHVNGTKFSHGSAITFLMDGATVPGSQPVQSNDAGNVRADLTVTTNWAVGQHVLMAKDAAGYSTAAGVVIVIVQQGDAHTPGMNGSPTNAANFTINVTSDANDQVTGGKYHGTDTIDVKNGVVSTKRDDGNPYTYTNTFTNGGSFTETDTYSNKGSSYKNGKLIYTETVLTFKAVLSNGAVCEMNTPFINEYLEGSFTNQNTISGTFRSDSFPQIPCSDGKTSVFHNAFAGTFTGTLEGQPLALTSLPVQIDHMALFRLEAILPKTLV